MAAVAESAALRHLKSQPTSDDKGLCDVPTIGWQTDNGLGTIGDDGMILGMQPRPA